MLQGTGRVRKAFSDSPELCAAKNRLLVPHSNLYLLPYNVPPHDVMRPRTNLVPSLDFSTSDLGSSCCLVLVLPSDPGLISDLVLVLVSDLVSVSVSVSAWECAWAEERRGP